MKTFRLIGMALVAVMMCLNFAACSSDDDEIEEQSGETSLIGTWAELNSDEEQRYYTFRADKTGAVWPVFSGEKGNEINFTWNATTTEVTIIYTGGYDSGETYDYKIKGGLLYFHNGTFKKVK